MKVLSFQTFPLAIGLIVQSYISLSLCYLNPQPVQQQQFYPASAAVGIPASLTSTPSFPFSAQSLSLRGLSQSTLTNQNIPSSPSFPSQNPSNNLNNQNNIPISPSFSAQGTGGFNQNPNLPNIPSSPAQSIGGANQNNLNIPSNNIPSSASVGTSAGGLEFYDFSYMFDNDTIFYPGQRFHRFHLLRDVGPTTNTTSNNYQYSYASYSMCLSEHGGTHIDAPFHFNRFGWRLGEIPLERLVDVPAVVVDVERHVFVLKNPDEFELTVDHLMEHEARYGQIPQGAVVIIRFGWGRFWPDWARYAGWDNSTARTGGPEYTVSFPIVSGAAASWLLRERRIIGLGTDTMSPDPDPGDNVVHILLLENQVYILENVANLDYFIRRTRGQGSRRCDLRMFILPMKTMGTGGPVRLAGYCRNG